VFENFSRLVGSLAWAEHHFGHSDPQMTVVIYLGETKVFEGKIAKFVDSVIGREFAATHVFQQKPNRFCIQRHGGMLG
jgi:hypothetical protein